MDFSLYEVGGKIRDELLGLTSKDVDYVAVPNEGLLKQYDDVETMFNLLSTQLKEENFEIFLETPNCFTIRAKFPESHQYSGVADFVMARKEIGYIEGTRTPIVKPGSLFDDLLRRDFTVNAIAKDLDGNLIDPFDGQKDLIDMVLRTPMNIKTTFNDDPLRILRALRFSITKNLKIPEEMEHEIHVYDYDEKMFVVSEERIREELLKCLKNNTIKTLELLSKFDNLRNYIFNKTNIWLKPTTEKQ